MADSFEQREGILKEANLNKLQASNAVCLELVKPLDKSQSSLFTNEQWITAEFMNDFFIESHNFIIIKELMTLNNEEYCLVSYAYPFCTTTYYKLSTTIDINSLRQLMNNECDRYADWVFISTSKTWAALSFYDGDELFIGYQQSFKTCLEERIKSNPDFVKFL